MLASNTVKDKTGRLHHTVIHNKVLNLRINISADYGHRAVFAKTENIDRYSLSIKERTQFYASIPTLLKKNRHTPITLISCSLLSATLSEEENAPTCANGGYVIIHPLVEDKTTKCSKYKPDRTNHDEMLGSFIANIYRDSSNCKPIATDCSAIVPRLYSGS